MKCNSKNMFLVVFLEETTESTDLKLGGRDFRSLGATVAKALSPLLLSIVC